MRELLVVVVPALVLAALAEINSTYDIGKFGEKVYLRKDKMFYSIMAVMMAVFVGLRVSYNDTYAYRHAYELFEKGSSVFKGIDWSIGSNPGFNVMNRILKNIGFETQDFLMFYALITVCVYIWFVRKYSENLWLSMFFFITMGCYTFTMAAIKQTVAVAFCLVATDKAIEKKWISFILCVLLAATFHPYSLMYLIVPLLSFAPWTSKSYLMISIFGVAGIGLDSLLGTLVNVTTMFGEGYDVASFSDAGVNVFRVAVVWVPVILSLLARRYTAVSENSANNIMLNLATLNAEIMFVGLFGTANYFARLANYFLIFQAIALPMMFKFYNRKSRKLLVLLAVVCFSLYFVYAEAITNGGFDYLFRRITFDEYIRSLWG